MHINYEIPPSEELLKINMAIFCMIEKDDRFLPEKSHFITIHKLYSKLWPLETITEKKAKLLSIFGNILI